MTVKRFLILSLVSVLLLSAPFTINAQTNKMLIKITYTDYVYEVHNPNLSPTTYDCYAVKNVYITGNFNLYYLDELISTNLSQYEYHTSVRSYAVANTYKWNDTNTTSYDYTIGDLRFVSADDDYDINVNVSNLKWNFPIESFPFTAAIMQNQTLTEWSEDLNYFYPTFQCASGSRIFNATINPNNIKANEYIFVIGVNANVYNDSTFDACFNITSDSNNHKLEYVETLFRNNFGNISIVKGKITSTNNSTCNCYINAAKDLKILSIYGNYSYYQNLSADFASLYNLSQHQASVDDLDEANQDLGSSMSNMFTTEDSYNQDLNNQLNNINFNDQLTGQQGFLTSSNFVINVFNQLIFNNPLTILIIIISIFYVAKRFI